MGSEAQLFCQVRLGVERGAEAIALVEAVTGQPCPCKRGLVCPLMPVAEAPAAAV